MAKQIKYSDEARDAILKGAQILAKTVGTTLGPLGRNVAIDRKWGSPNVVHDGVTVAKEIELEDPFENMGAQLVKEAAEKTNDNAGDGRDISWIWDADMEIIEEEQNRIKHIVCSGLRSGDMALRVKYAGYPVDRLEIKTNLKEAIEHITGLEGEAIYLLSTYSALFECRKILLELQKRTAKTPDRIPARG